MAKADKLSELEQLITDAQQIVVVQADNPDVDSLASALALEAILSQKGKQVSLYCGVDLPAYLHYLPGWSRVNDQLPKKFDLSVIVDTSADSLLQQLSKSGEKSWLAARPAVILDHHATSATISFAALTINPPAVATTEIIYEIGQQLGWPTDLETKKLLAMGILSDSLGLTSESTSARAIHIIAELVEAGVNIAELESARRESIRREPELIHYKGRLLQRVEFHANERVATIDIPFAEIERYSPLYNPSMLVIDDMRLGKNTEVAIAFKVYGQQKVTAKIRCNYGWGIADKLAEHFGGGGHPLASGFKITDGRDFGELKTQVIDYAVELLEKLEAERASQTV